MKIKAKKNDEIIFDSKNKVFRLIYLFSLIAARTHDFMSFEIGDFKRYGEYNLQQLIYSSRRRIPFTPINKSPISDKKDKEIINYNLDRGRKTTHITNQIESVLHNKIPELSNRKLSPSNFSIIFPYLWVACSRRKNIFHSALNEIHLGR
jgi:hypothetical protein